MTDLIPDTEPLADHEDAAEEDELSKLVAETVTALLKVVRARQTYVPGNPLIERFHDELCEKLGVVWGELPHVSLTVDEGRLLWRDREVYAKPLSPDNFAKSMDGGADAYLPKNKLAELDVFLDDVLNDDRQKPGVLGVWFDRVKGYYEKKFGPGWLDEYKGSWH